MCSALQRCNPIMKKLRLKKKNTQKVSIKFIKIVKSANQLKEPQRFNLNRSSSLLMTLVVIVIVSRFCQKQKKKNNKIKLSQNRFRSKITRATIKVTKSATINMSKSATIKMMRSTITIGQITTTLAASTAQRVITTVLKYPSKLRLKQHANYHVAKATTKLNQGVVYLKTCIGCNQTLKNILSLKTNEPHSSARHRRAHLSS